MTDPTQTPETPETGKATPAGAAARPSFWRGWLRPHTPLGWAAEALLVLVLVGALGLVALRYGPLTTEARLLIESQLNGFQLGPLGKLKIEGLRGDIFSRFTVRRLTIADPKGVWLRADGLQMRWRPLELLWGRLHIQSAAVGQAVVYRQPVLTPQPKGGKGPDLSLQFDAVKARIDTEPAFSQTRGVYDVSGAFDLERKGPIAARLDMASVLRPGDYLHARFNLGRKDAMLVDAEAREVKGGGIAGSLGLAADKPFTLSVHLTGKPSAGRLAALAQSGVDRPLQATGAWTPEGGRVSAKLMLTQSRWTRGWANAFGPEAQIDLATKRRDKATYELDAKLASANLGLVLRGPVDPNKRTSKGLAAALVINSLTKLVPQPIMGKGQVQGVLSGNLGDVRLSGLAQVADLEFLDYRLAKVAGPVRLNWKNRRLVIQADVAGSGAGGQGIIAAAGGPAPKGQIEVDGLPDGHVLIKSMSIAGKGVKIDGSGGQNLFGGGLTFKGQLVVPQMAAVSPGGAGSFQAGWSASQSTAPGAPWTFTVEAHGDKFATGNATLDQLFGASPKLTGTAGFVGDTISFDKVTLDGAKASANMAGQWKLDGSIRFALGWQADGPLALGPLELDGKAKGQGDLTGTIGAPRLDLQSDLAAINFPDMTIKAAKLGLTFAKTAEGSDGHVDLVGQSEYGPARGKSEFRFAGKNLTLTGLDVDAGGMQVKGQVAILDQGAASADLTVAAGPGVLLTQGHASGRIEIAGAQGQATAAIQLEAKDAVLRGAAVAFSQAKIVAHGPVGKLPYQVSADGAVAHAPFKLNGQGVFAQYPKGFTVGFDGTGQLRRSNFRTLETALVKLDDGDHSARLRLALGGGRAELDARETADQADVKAVLTGVDLSFVSEDFTGQFDASLDLNGRGKDLHGALDAALKNAHSRDAKPGLSIDGDVKAQLAGDRLTVASDLRSQQGLTSSANFVLPVDAAAAPFHVAVVRDRPMQGHFEADGEIQPLWDLFLGGERSLGGKLTAKAEFAGSVGDPKITGRADLTGGHFEDFPTGLKLRDATIGASLDTDTVSVDTFKASDSQKGQVSGSGKVSLARGGGGNLVINLSNFRLVDNDTATADTTGQLTLVRNADGKVRIAGALEVVRGDINAAAKTPPDIPTMEVIEKNRPFSLQEQLQPPAATQPGVELDIALTAKRGLLVKGRGLDVDMSLDAKVTGNSSKPVLSGEARVVRGEYDFGGTRFTFDNRGTVQLSNDPRLIRLNLTATREDPTLTAVITIQGTAAKPQIDLTSTPVLPRDEILAQVLFGSSAAQLSPFQAAQLASALTALASGGGFDVIGGIRNFARLDRLALIGNGAEGVSVAGGKYIGDKFYVQVAGGGREGPSAEVEYRITRNLLLASRLANLQPAATTTTTPGTVVQTGSSISIRWRQDFRDKPK